MTINDFKLLLNLASKFRAARDNWLQFLVQVSVVLFGVLTALYNTPQSPSHRAAHIILTIALIILGLGILFSCIALFSEAYIANRMFLDKKEAVLNNRALKVNNEPKLFSILRWCAYICFLVSFIGFIGYLLVNLMALI